MRKFMITVNGNSYEVEVEEIKDGSVVSTPVQSAPAAPKAAPSTPAAPKAAPAAPKAAPKAAAGGSATITAPMPGTILDIKVKEGDSVSKGQIVAILEAMKMENEIMASADGKIASINVVKGASVNAGDVLITIG